MQPDLLETTLPAEPAPEVQKQKCNLDSLIQDVRNARAQAAMIDPADVSAALEHSENLKEDLLLIADEIAEYENQAKALELYKKDIQERKNRLASTAATLREIILQAMDMNSIPSLPGTASTLNTNRLDPALIITDESQVPSRFFDPRPAALNLAALKAHYKETGEIPEGCDLDNGKISLTIRRK